MWHLTSTPGKIGLTNRVREHWTQNKSNLSLVNLLKRRVSGGRIKSRTAHAGVAKTLPFLKDNQATSSINLVSFTKSFYEALPQGSLPKEQELIWNRFHLSGWVGPYPHAQGGMNLRTKQRSPLLSHTNGFLLISCSFCRKIYLCSYTMKGPDRSELIWRLADFSLTKSTGKWKLI